MDDERDREAIARMQAGDVGGLEPLVRKYQLAAVRTAYLITRDRQLAEDIAQAAFIRAYERIGQFDASRPFRPWLLKSIANDAVKHLERSRRTVPLDDSEDDDERSLVTKLVDSDPQPEDIAVAEEESERIWRLVGELGPKQRAAIVLRYYADLNDEEVARRLGSPPATVRWYLHSARKRLRQWLGGSSEAESDGAARRREV